MIYWFTGQPGSGKSTLAAALKTELRRRGMPAVHLDGEELREFTDNRDYSRAGRIRNIRAGQKLAAKLSQDGIYVTASFVSPYRWLREEFKMKAKLVEVYVHTATARGKEGFFVEDYEPPLAHFIDIDTTTGSVAECVERILGVTWTDPRSR
ncbi:MAG: adenylyl-sulfate kinase [Verrucomicrobia subdivision 3 bacterium]|nr:adenylyl-sulfate kinase [Limisphaerales bacterium]